jgi:hypothetical protein
MDPQLQGFPLKGYGVIVLARKLYDIGKPVRKSDRFLEVELDHITVHLIVDLIIHLVADMQRGSQAAPFIADGRIHDLIGSLSCIVMILTGIDKVLRKWQSLIIHDNPLLF